MSNIKVIPNKNPWEVMKAWDERTEENPVQLARLSSGGNYDILMSNPLWNWHGLDKTYAIVDDSQPELTGEWWDDFDWPFFDQYRGIPITIDGMVHTYLHKSPSDKYKGITTLRESPPYAWSGGKQPVSDEVEVEVTCISADMARYVDTLPARRVMWSNADIISFSITGNIIN